MSRLLIANDCPAQMVGAAPGFSEGLAIWSLRILWYMEAGDILVLPLEPDLGHVDYIAELKGIQPNQIQIVVAPAGAFAHLSPDRMTHPALYEAIRLALRGRLLTTVLPLTPDASVSALAHALGASCQLPGASFAQQGGGILANSKVSFRAIAAGAHVPIPEGTVANSPEEASQVLHAFLLTQGVPAIIKKEFGQGCRGNEVLTPVMGIESNGGRSCLVLSDRGAIETYIENQWAWLSNAGQHGVVIEQYFPGSAAIFVEFSLTETGVTFAGLGEMLARPIADGQVIPPVGLSPTTIAKLVTGGYRLSAAMHAIGYRGMLSADAIVTPCAQVLFNEYNGRITGSTHIYAIVGDHIVGKAAMQHRVLLERRGWSAPSFQTAVDNLKRSGLAYNPVTQTGVILTGTFIPTRKVISYTVVATDLDAALHLEGALHEVSPRLLEAPA